MTGRGFPRPAKELVATRLAIGIVWRIVFDYCVPISIDGFVVRLIVNRVDAVPISIDGFVVRWRVVVFATRRFIVHPPAVVAGRRRIVVGRCARRRVRRLVVRWLVVVAASATVVTRDCRDDEGYRHEKWHPNAIRPRHFLYSLVFQTASSSLSYR